MTSLILYYLCNIFKFYFFFSILWNRACTDNLIVSKSNIMYFINLYKSSTLKSRLKKKKGKKDLFPTATADCFFLSSLLFYYLFTFLAETRVRTFVIKRVFVYTYKNNKCAKTQIKDETRCSGGRTLSNKTPIYIEM